MANMISDVLAGDSEVFASDDDPDLVREALPFGLKTYESLLAVSPEHEGLLLSAAKGFTAYAYLLQDEADRIDQQDVIRARLLRVRAKRLYLRGRDYSIRGLELVHPRFEIRLRHDPGSTVAETSEDDAPFLYWAAVSWAGALSAEAEDLDLLSETPLINALINRVVKVHESYEDGAAHEFLVLYDARRPGGSVAQAREHFRRFLELAKTPHASIYVSMAESVSVPEQNLSEFKKLLATALAVDPNQDPKLRLANVVAQRRARWLLTRTNDLFLEVDHAEDKP